LDKRFFSNYFLRTLLGSFSNFNHHISRGAVLITAVSVIILILLQQPFAKKFKVIPAPLLVVAAGIIITFFLPAQHPAFPSGNPTGKYPF